MALQERNVIKMNERLSFTKTELETIKRTVAMGATEDEFMVFIHLAETYGLDPFNKEIWFIKSEGENPIIRPAVMDI